MQELEQKLNEVFVKNAPVQLPKNFKTWLADYAWIFALVGFVLGVLAVFPLLAVLGLASIVASSVGASSYVALAWVSFIALLVYLVVLGISIPKLKNKESAGWDLTYYSTLAYFAYSVVYAVSYRSSGAVFTLFWNIVGLVVGLYFIFQIRSYFKGSTNSKKSTSK